MFLRTKIRLDANFILISVYMYTQTTQLEDRSNWNNGQQTKLQSNVQGHTSCQYLSHVTEASCWHCSQPKPLGGGKWLKKVWLFGQKLIHSECDAWWVIIIIIVCKYTTYHTVELWLYKRNHARTCWHLCIHLLWRKLNDFTLACTLRTPFSSLAAKSPTTILFFSWCLSVLAWTHLIFKLYKMSLEWSSSFDG